MKKFKAISFLGILLFGLFILAPSLSAKTYYPTFTPTATPTAAPIESINSFETFWPLTAGKTIDDPLYFLKSLKEKLRGIIIFGAPQKLDYSVLLATKRTLEAEKLIKGGKTDLARKTLEKAKFQLDNAESNLKSAKSSGQSLGQVSQVVSSRLLNIEKLTKWLATQNSDLRDILTEIANKVSSLSLKL